LYVIEMGGNDIRDAIVAYQTGGLPAAQGILQQAILSIAQNIQALYAADARSFLVWLPPNPGLTPALQTLDQMSPGVVQLATLLTQGFNDGLSATLAQLSQLPGISIRTLDASSLLDSIVSDPSAYGLTNTSDACITPGHRALLLPGAGRLPVLGWHPPDARGARDRRGGRRFPAGPLRRLVPLVTPE
jgi:phospholipase/lecithinase/hemolysin